MSSLIKSQKWQIYFMSITLLLIVCFSFFLVVKGYFSKDKDETKTKVVAAIEKYYSAWEIKSIKIHSIKEIENFGEVNPELNINHIQEIVDIYEQIDNVYNEVPPSLISEFYNEEKKRLLEDRRVLESKGDSLIAESVNTYLAFIGTFGDENMREAYYLNAMQQKMMMYKLLEVWKKMKGYRISARVKFKNRDKIEGEYLLNDKFLVVQEVK